MKIERAKDSAIGTEAQMISNCFQDAIKVMILTSEAVLPLVRKNSETDALKRQNSYKYVDRRALGMAIRADKLQNELRKLRQITMLNRAQLKK